MKKIWWVALIAAAVIFVIMAVIVAVNVFEHMFPMAEPIRLPDSQVVTEIFAQAKGGERKAVDVTELDKILDKLRNAEPTRIWSVNDYPTVTEYYVLEIETPEDRAYRYFVYRENARIYIESPYDGIYETDESFFELISSYLLN